MGESSSFFERRLKLAKSGLGFIVLLGTSLAFVVAWGTSFQTKADAAGMALRIDNAEASAKDSATRVDMMAPTLNRLEEKVDRNHEQLNNKLDHVLEMLANPRRKQ